MVVNRPDREPPRRLGPTLLRAWAGYRRRVDQELAAAGFGERRIPDGRVLRLCADADGLTISEIGRQLEITRQGASKIVAGLRDNDYVTLSPSQTDAREKVVQPTARGLEFLRVRRQAARKVERELRETLGPEVVAAVYQVADALSDDEALPRDYLRAAARRLLRSEE
jgi:DNA-binding MarR family transcriptional regulator